MRSSNEFFHRCCNFAFLFHKFHDKQIRAIQHFDYDKFRVATKYGSNVSSSFSRLVTKTFLRIYRIILDANTYAIASELHVYKRNELFSTSVPSFAVVKIIFLFILFISLSRSSCRLINK